MLKTFQNQFYPKNGNQMKIIRMITTKLVMNYQKYMFYKKLKIYGTYGSCFYLYSHSYKKAHSVLNSYGNQEITM